MATLFGSSIGMARHYRVATRAFTGRPHAPTAIAIATDSRMSEIAEASRLPYINVSLQFEQTNISLKSPLNMVWYHFPHPEGPRPGIDWRQIISQVGFLIA